MAFSRTRRAVAAAGLLLTACSSSTASAPGSSASSPSPSPSASTSTSSSATPTPTPVPTPPPPPPLTAPTVIQVENLFLARPQSGVAAATFVYEYETEGGITRFSLFYFTPPTTVIGPVRSARIVTVRLIQAYNATLMYSGAGHYVEGLLASMGLRHYSEGSGAMFRIRQRRPPHNLYTDPGHVNGLTARVHPPAVAYQLWTRTPLTALPAGGTPATRFTVPISNAEQPRFVYDAAAKAYTRIEPNTGTFVDAATGRPWQIPTVVVMHVPIRPNCNVRDVSGACGVEHTIAGTGPAEVFVGGVEYHATFNQGPSGPPSFTLAGGAPAPIAPGQALFIYDHVGSTEPAS